MNTNDLFGPRLKTLQGVAIAFLLAGLVLGGIGFSMDAGQACQSYLVAYLFWFGVTGGSLAWLMIHHCTGGGWGFILRRPLEAATRNLWLMAVLFIPLAFFLPKVYPWADAVRAAKYHFQGSKAAYLQPGAFIERTVFYYVVWIVIMTLLNKWGKVQDERDDPKIAHKLNLLSAPGLVVYVLTMTFAAIDWLMSVTPEWASSLFGAVVIIGQGLSTLAIMSVLVGFLAGKTELIAEEIPRRFVRDVGNLTLAFTLLWGYMNFSQWMIIWSGNISDESGFYVTRTTHGWLYIGAGVIVCQFFLPFLTLLSSGLKVKFANLKWLGLIILAMRIIDLYWYVVPTWRPDRLVVNPADLGMPLLLGGIWLLAWAWQIKDKALVPVHDPRVIDHWPLREAVEHV